MKMSNYTIIPSFPDYMIDEFGNVFSTLSNKILKHRVRNDDGYLFVTMLTEGKESKNVSVSRLVAHVFLNMNELYNELHVDHIDCDILNNHYSNLQVLTPEQHAIKTINDNQLNQRNEVCFCQVCNIEITWGCTFCIEHSPARLIKNPNLTLTDIENSVKICGWKKAAIDFNLSDKGLRKNYKRLGGDPKSLRKTK